MSRISVPAPDAAAGPLADIFAAIRKAVGKVPNTYAAIGALSPSVLKAYLDAEAALSAGSLSRQEEEVIKLTVSEATGCDYCVAAHSALGKMAGLDENDLRKFRGGIATGDAKLDALSRFVRILATESGTVSEAEFNAIREAGFTSQQLAEISFAVSLIVFTNVFNRINDTDVDFPKVDLAAVA